MKITSLRVLAIASACVAALAGTAHAQVPDATFNNGSDILLYFFQQPSTPHGAVTVGNSTAALGASIGLSRTFYRDAATPSSGNYGLTIFRGNIGGNLTSMFTTGWFDLNTLYVGAAGTSAATAAGTNTITAADYARTIYTTRPRAGAGTAGYQNSSTPTFDPSSDTTASAMNTALGSFAGTSPSAVLLTGTSLDDRNPVTFATGQPGLAYTSISPGVMGRFSSTDLAYTLGTVTDVVMSLDLFRVTETINTISGSQAGNSTLWHNANSIPGGQLFNYPGPQQSRSDFLGTIALRQNGDVYWVGVIPEPTTATLLGLAATGIVAFAGRRRRLNA